MAQHTGKFVGFTAPRAVAAWLRRELPKCSITCERRVRPHTLLIARVRSG